MKAVQTLMLEAELYSNIQRTLPAWIFLAVLLVFHLISITNTCMVACYRVYDCWNSQLLYNLVVSFHPAGTVLFLWQIPSVAYIIAQSMHSNFSTGLSQVHIYIWIASVHPTCTIFIRLCSAVWVCSRGWRNCCEDDELRRKKTTRDYLGYMISTLDDFLEGHVLEGSWRSPFRTLARWTVRGTVKITRFFLFLARTIITRGSSANRVPHTGGHSYPIWSNSPLSGHLQREELCTTLDARSQDSARSSIEPEFPVTERMDQWIQTVPLTRAAGNFARLNSLSSIDVESGRYNGHGVYESLSSHSV